MQPPIATSRIELAEILKILPHRYPFLMVDRIDSFLPGSTIEGHKNVSRGDWWAADADVMPQALLLEAMAQTACILTYKTFDLTPGSDAVFFFASIEDARVHRCPRAGERLVLQADAIRLMRSRGIGKLKTVARVGTEVVAEGEMMAAMKLGS